MNQKPSPARQLMAPVRALFVSDSSAGILLILVAALAMFIANSQYAEEYHHLFHGAIGWMGGFKLNSLHLWINDGLMAIFFFVVGLEVKREIVEGQLSTPDRRRLPVMAAIAGMAVPAMVYLFFTAPDPALTRGWAIPAATDIAFAMGVLGLLGSRVPASLRLFLLTVAIADDVGAVMVIALFYTANLKIAWLVGAIVVTGVMLALNRMRISSIPIFVIFSLILWFFVLNSGVHATIAGVVAALTVPMHSKEGKPVLETMEHVLAPWSAYLIVPLFGFANAGVNISNLGLAGVLAPLPLAIAAGLVVGKQLGIFSAIFIADRIGFAPRPTNATWTEIWGVTILCGIGFTMSLFIGALAFPHAPELVENAKIGVLLGSLISAVLGYVVLRVTTKHPEEAHLTAPRIPD